jgi:hypothetical protein
MVPHGWLTPAAPGGATGGRNPIVANVRLRFARVNRSQPRLAYVSRSWWRYRWTQPNRCKCTAPFCTGESFTAKAGLRQPLLVALPVDATQSLQMCGSALHGRIVSQPRLAYASRSWCRHWWTHANPRKCAASLCTGDSFHNHRWLTSAAPGCVHLVVLWPGM